VDPSSLTRWRNRIGEEGVEWLLTKTIEAGRKAGVISERSAEMVIVDTTVMEKAIAHPTDTRLYEKARRRLVKLAQEAGLPLRQSYARLAPRLAGQVGRYAHARQFKRMQKGLRRLKGYTGRILREIQRQLGAVTDCQSARKTDPSSASNFDPPWSTEIRA
jgi:IS5 family transposase